MDASRQSMTFADERGSQMLQFTMTCGTFFVALLFLFDLFQFGFRVFSAQFIAERATRDVIVGDPSSANGICNANRVNTTKTNALNRATFFGITGLTAADIEVCPLTSLGICGGANGGKPGEYIEVTVTVPLTLFLFRKTVQLKGFAIGRNEKFRDCP